MRKQSERQSWASRSAVLGLCVFALACGDSASPPSSCGAGASEPSLYDLPGQPTIAGRQVRQCTPSVCDAARRVSSALISVDDGPVPYTLTRTENSASAAEMGRIYTDVLGVTSVRPDEAARAFDIRCMFPVSDLNAIPDPSDDANWNWEESDVYFSAIVDAGMAPLLKLAVKSWNSTRLSGLSYTDENSQDPQYVIPAQSYADCDPWPANAPVIDAIGPQLVLKIVERYNNPARFGFRGRPALEADTWAESGGFAGVELMNEWGELVCGPLGALPESVCEGAGGVVDAATWTDACAGEPNRWGSRYWDGTPEQAWDFYSKAALALRSAFPKVRVGGPATSTGSSFWACGNADGVGRDWMDGFLSVVRETRAPIDFYSWHYYDPGQGVQPSGGPEFEEAHDVMRHALTAAGFADVPMAVTEYNTAFELGTETALVGSAAGAAQNTAKFAQMVGWGDIEAAFLYTGRDGAFEPENPYSFPLGCTADFSTAPGSQCECDSETGCTPGCTPQDIVFSGTWTDCSVEDLSSVADLPACLEGECQFGPAPDSGMGAVLADGTTRPMGAALRFWAPAKGSRILELREPAKTRLREAGVYAVAWQAPSDSRYASLLIANPFPATSGDLPSPGELLGGVARVVGASRVEQYAKGESPDQAVSGVDGVTSTQTLVGDVASACRVQNRGADRMAPLQPYETQLLAVAYDSGCLCGP